MEFEQQAQEDLYARVATYMRQAFGDLAEALEDEPGFVLRLGKAGLLVLVNANGPELASVMILSQLAEGLPATPGLQHAQDP